MVFLHHERDLPPRMERRVREDPPEGCPVTTSRSEDDDSTEAPFMVEERSPSASSRLPRIQKKKPLWRNLWRGRSLRNKKKKDVLETFAPLNDSAKPVDLNTTGVSLTTDSSSIHGTSFYYMDTSLSSALAKKQNDDEEASDHTEHESFTQLDVPEMLCRQESGLEHSESNLIVTRTSSLPKDARARQHVLLDLTTTTPQTTKTTTTTTTHDSSTPTATSLSSSSSESKKEQPPPPEEEAEKAATGEGSWLPPLDLDYLISLTNGDLLAREDRPVTEIHIPVRSTERSKSFASDWERTSREEIFQHFLDDTFVGSNKNNSRRPPPRSRSTPHKIVATTTPPRTRGSTSSDFPSPRKFPQDDDDEEEIMSGRTTLPSSGNNLRKVQSAWTPARTRRTQLARQEHDMFLSKKGQKAWNRPEFDATNEVVVKPCLVQTRSLNEKYNVENDDSLLNFPVNGEKLFGTTTTTSKTVASTDDSASIYATSDDLEDANSMPEVGPVCGLLFSPCTEIHKHVVVRNTDESVHSEDFSVLLRHEIGAKRSSAELLNEIRTEVLETVQELARGGSTAMKKFIEKRRNK